MLKLTGTSKNFLNKNPVAQEIKSTLDKQAPMKLESLCTAQETVKQVARQPTEWEKTITIFHLRKDQCLEYTKN